MNASLIEFAYIIASVLFIFGLKMLGTAKTARLGNALSALGMAIAVAATLSKTEVTTYSSILLGIALGMLIGVPAARLIKMTAIPQMVGLFNGLGGLASMFVAWAEYRTHSNFGWEMAVPVYAAILIGGITFSGSLVAFGKLAEKISGRPILFPGQKILNGLLLLALFAGWGVFVIDPLGFQDVFRAALIVSLIFGILIVIPIGGADMPVVIALLNSYSGLAACAAGFVIENNVLIVAGSLVGASGFILTAIMCKAMNRSLANVLFGGVGAIRSSKKTGPQEGEVKPISTEDTYFILEAARSVIFVPGYGMAVAQAQHAIQELAVMLEERGVEVKFAIHPVAGRMPGHMNVLLAEANVPYEQLFVPEDVNPTMEHYDVAVVIGANDVVNPAAREDSQSPLYGMPIIEVDRAKVCVILKRSMKPGFAGIDNSLFFKENVRMLFGDAKASLSGLAGEFKES